MDSFESRMNPRFLAESEKGMLWESNRIREENSRRFQGRRKGKEKSFCFVIVQFELIFHHPCFYVVCACTEFFGDVGQFTDSSGFLELCVICEKHIYTQAPAHLISTICATYVSHNTNAYNKTLLFIINAYNLVIYFICWKFYYRNK